MIPIQSAAPAEESTALALRLPRPTQELIALLRTALTTPPLPLFLDLKAASAYSGLSQSLSAARS